MRLAKQLGAIRAVDVGAGSGILAISLALETNMNVVATDISADALEVAKLNARQHRVNLEWNCGDLLEPVSGPIDLIVSNPPYVSTDDAPAMQREIFHEPAIAIFAPDEGLDVATRLLRQGIDRAAKGAVMEIGSGQGGALQRRALEMGWGSVEIKQDMAKHDRILIALPKLA
jgi:release factor glutamine methyltransferase